MKNAVRVVLVFFGAIVSSGHAVSLGDCLNAPQLTWSSGGQSPWLAQSTISHDGTDAAQSGAITDGEETWVETQLTGPGILTFWWKVSSEQSFDWLEFSLNSQLQTRISGDVNWQQGFFPIPGGTYAARWRYVKDPSSDGGSDSAWLDQVGFQPTFSLVTGIDTSGFTFSSSGDKLFFGETNVTHDGVDAVQSGRITDTETSTLQTTIIGPATISFWWKVSSEEGYDWLSFYINGTLKKQISGEADWAKETYDIPSGPQTLTWQYAKDSSASSGQDAGWIDQVNLGSALATVPAFGLAATLQGNHSLQLRLTGTLSGNNYRIQTSSNLLDWVPWTQVIATNNLMVVVDTNSSPTRFYRAVSP